MKQRALVAAGLLALAITSSSWSTAAPFIPSDDAAVLEQLPEARDPTLASLKRLRVAQHALPQDLRLAAAFARRAIEASRASGDPRYLGQAQAALAPWWAEAEAPSTALLLRATIKQSLHDFPGALADLDRLVAREPADAQARITRATVRAVVGRHDDAIADCRALAPSVPRLVAAACMASSESQRGRAEQAQAAIESSLAEDAGSSAGVRAWALTLAGEIAARRGDPVAAERHFRAALALDPADAYLLGVYADLLLDRGRASEVVSLLVDHARHDALLLRIVLAEARLPARGGAHSTHRAEMAARFEAARMRGDALHRREEARYVLAIEGDAARALALALANWAVQKESADLRILVEAARAANDTAASKLAADWIAKTGLEDRSLGIGARAGA